MPATTCFQGGEAGAWEIVSIGTIAGPGEDWRAARLAVTGASEGAGAKFTLRGVASNIRYSTREEAKDLRSVQAGLGRSEARSAALIPISKSDAWWALAQDERRAIFEEDSRHHSIGRRYLPEIARKLYHARDLGEPFDFLTWFEFAPGHEMLFNRLLEELRASREWTFVTREIDIRLTRAG